MSTLLCSRHHRSSPGCLSSSQTGTLFPLNANSPGPAPQPLATAPLLSVSMNNLPALGTSCTWNRTVLVFRSWLRHLTQRVENFSLLSFPQRVLVQCASQSRMPGLNRDGQISGPRRGPEVGATDHPPGIAGPVAGTCPGPGPSPPPPLLQPRSSPQPSPSVTLTWLPQADPDPRGVCRSLPGTSQDLLGAGWGAGPVSTWTLSVPRFLPSQVSAASHQDH